MFKIKIFHLYPDEMNLYGDLGNVQTLYNRAKWRDIEVEIVPIKKNSKVDFSQADIIFMGGGQDRGQRIISPDLVSHGPAIKNETEKGLVALGVCGGFQLFGNYFQTASGEKIDGIGIMEVYTVAGDTRFIGNIVVDITQTASRWAVEDHLHETNTKLTTLVGFENHSGLTYLEKETKPLGNVIIGYGNTGDHAFEGAVYKNVYGTYLHGPLLPKNPHFADHLILSALRRKHDDSIILKPLDDSLERSAHYAAVERSKTARTVHL